MCLLITGQSAKVRSTLLDTTGLIADIFGSNPDGLGVMYVNSRGLQRIKSLPKDAVEAREFIERLPDDDRQLALHWRWKTHGHIDMENCHPYDIEAGVSAMMHNGVLHTGNKADATKSDTWHFARGYLAGSTPDTLHDPNFAFLLGEFIGDNRFAIMTADGRLTVVNQEQGIEHGDVWFSNTYAWSPELLIPGYRSTRYKAWSGFSVTGHDEFDAWDDYYQTRNGSTDTSIAKAANSLTPATQRDVQVNSKTSPYYGWTLGEVFDDIDKCMVDYDLQNLADAIKDMPCTVLGYIARNYETFEWNQATADTMGAEAFALRELLLEALDTPCGSLATFLEFVELVRDGTIKAAKVAESLLYYCNADKDDVETLFSDEVPPTDFAAHPAVEETKAVEELKPTAQELQLELTLDDMTACGVTEAPDYVG